MKTADDYLKEFKQINDRHLKRLEILRRRETIMRNTILGLILVFVVCTFVIALTGCSTMSPRQKTIARAVVAGAVVATIAAHKSEQASKVGVPTSPCTSNPESCR